MMAVKNKQKKKKNVARDSQTVLLNPNKTI
jgi:hypothetical protein